MPERWQARGRGPAIGFLALLVAAGQLLTLALLGRAVRWGGLGGVVVVLALALLPDVARAGAGWYLLIPPIADMRVVAWGRPLREWNQRGAFDSAQACERARRALSEAAERALAPGGEVDKLGVPEGDPKTPREMVAVSTVALRVAEQGGRCLASDDPRLR